MNVRCFICGVQKYIFFFIPQNLFSTFLIFFENKSFPPSSHTIPLILMNYPLFSFAGRKNIYSFLPNKIYFHLFENIFENNFSTPLYSLDSLKQRATKVMLFFKSKKLFNIIIWVISILISLITLERYRRPRTCRFLISQCVFLRALNNNELF